MKRIIALLLTALLVTSLIAGCGRANDSSNPVNTLSSEPLDQDRRTQEQKSSLLDAWFSCLSYYEQIYSSLFQILEYSDDYVQDNSWESLLKARAASSAALVFLRQMEQPALNLTENETNLLLDEGIEVNAIQREFEALGDFQSEKDVTVSLLCYTLEDDVFLSVSVAEALPAMLEFYRNDFTLECRYLCQLTNYLLLQTEHTTQWAAWMEQLPCLAACADVWYDAPSDVEKACGQLLDEMEQLKTSMGSVLGTSEYSLEIVQEAVETGNLDRLSREINRISEVPGYFPIPSWLPDVLCLYLITDPDTQEKRLVHAGEELTQAPSACYIPCGEISKEDVEAYGLQLETWGVKTYGTWEESGEKYQMIANSGNSTMMIEWTREETILYLTEPVGCLIPELYLHAMAAE